MTDKEIEQLEQAGFKFYSGSIGSSEKTDWYLKGDRLFKNSTLIKIETREDISETVIKLEIFDKIGDMFVEKEFGDLNKCLKFIENCKM